MAASVEVEVAIDDAVVPVKNEAVVTVAEAVPVIGAGIDAVTVVSQSDGCNSANYGSKLSKFKLH